MGLDCYIWCLRSQDRSCGRMNLNVGNHCTAHCIALINAQYFLTRWHVIFLRRFSPTFNVGRGGQTLGACPCSYMLIRATHRHQKPNFWPKIWPSPQACHLYKHLQLPPCHLPPGFQTEKNPKEAKMSDWVVLDISAITKTTNREKVLKVLKAGGMSVCKVTDPYMSPTK